MHLKNTPLKFIEASDGKNAINIFKKNKIDAIISNIKMEKMNGLTMAKKIFEINRDIPIIFITAFSNTETILQTMHLGAFDFMSKTFQKEFLIKRLKNALEANIVREAEYNIYDILHEALKLGNKENISKLSFEDRVEYMQ